MFLLLNFYFVTDLTVRLPLIEQVFYSDYRAMSYYYFRSSNILKLGSYHGGLGKLKIKDINEWQVSLKRTTDGIFPHLFNFSYYFRIPLGLFSFLKTTAPLSHT